MRGNVSINAPEYGRMQGDYKDTYINDYRNLWIRRWISLFVLDKTDTGSYRGQKDGHGKEKVGHPHCIYKSYDAPISKETIWD